GDYFIQTTADNGVKVQADNQPKISRWTNGFETIERTLWLDVKEGIHSLKVEHYDDKYGAALFADVVPFNTWLAYYYPNQELKGSPDASKIIQPNGNKLKEDHGYGSPAEGVPSDNYSARYTTAKRLPAGEYVVRAKGDDKVRVYIDGKLELDLWKYGSYQGEGVKINILDRNVANPNEKDVHWIEVQYAEINDKSNVEFDIEPINKVLNTEEWVGYVYPNRDLTGRPIVLGGVGSHEALGHKLGFNWNYGSPSYSGHIPSDQFSTRFVKKAKLDAGDYFIQTTADNGVKVQADNQPKISRWTNGFETIERTLWLDVKEGIHSLKVEHYDDKYGAALFADVVPFNTWLAYYYPNQELKGSPDASKIIQPNGNKLKEDHGYGSPAEGVPSDNYSARYTTAKRLPAGEYVVRAKGDDKVRVYIDGKLELDLWKYGSYQGEGVKINILDRNVANPNEKDVHWIEVQYAEINDKSNVEFDIEPINKVLNTEEWVGYVYPNQNLTGRPIVLGGVGSHETLGHTLGFNWNYSSPSYSGHIPADHFSARFSKKAFCEAGTYVFDSRADDGVRVKIDNQIVLDFWQGNYGKVDKKSVYINEGIHEIVVEYYEITANAYLNVNYEKVSPNKIYYQFGNEVAYNWGYNSPSPDLPADHFEALFEQYNWYNNGDYFIQTIADNGIKVEIDGDRKIERWTNEFDTIERALWLNVREGFHNVRTRYYDDVYGAAVYSNVVPFDSWLAYYYPNEELNGSPVAAKILDPSSDSKSLIENIGNRSPAQGVPSDHFSARYVTAKRLPAGDYLIETKADDGIRVFIDGNPVEELDNWTNGSKENETIIKINNRIDVPPNESNIHWIEVRYYDYTYSSNVSFEIRQIHRGKIVKETSYNFSIDEMVANQLSANPQTDKNYDVYIRSDALILDPSNPSRGTVDGSSWNVRGGPGTNFWIIGKVNDQERLTILESVNASDGWVWFKINYNRTWVNASPQDVTYYVNPNSFDPNSASYFQFLVLSERAGINAQEVNQKILYNKGILSNKAQAFVDAATRFKVNEIYLISHALLEIGNGTSRLANGILVKEVNGSPEVLTNAQGIPLTINDLGYIPEGARAVYNMYGVGANDGNAEINGAIYAYQAGWFTPEAAIIGGAQFIGNGYVNAGQDTLYKMRWNPANPASHQYATDIGWAVKQTNRIASLYSLLDNYILRFDVPKYR
ncbi:glucosaminidase domain-containing protein, partial [Bacillaceae bacterium Marseille-Q3522]|nr:glucosaminidase domain-containing protein [Bacillaceae bacterium Marseille-Q3522]